MKIIVNKCVDKYFRMEDRYWLNYSGFDMVIDLYCGMFELFDENCLQWNWLGNLVT